MTSKFEQLIEYVINDEEAKAKELFHDIVVEKSREIYENLMTEEESEEELDEAEEDDAEEELDENFENLGDEVDAEEQGMQEDEESDAEFDDEAEEDGEDLTHDIEGGNDIEHDIEDRVVDLEDKLDELMAEFESLMGNEHGDSVSDMDGGDDLEMDDTETAEFGNGKEESDSEELDMMAENVALDKAPAPVTSEPAGTQTKSTVAFNSGAKGMQGAPVKMTGDTAQGRPAPKTGDLPEAGQFKNTPGKGGSNSKLAAAPKPVTAQATGVNTKTPFPKG
jgi:exosome complex component RRP41